MVVSARQAAYDFRDAVALVTGGASGIGEACVRALAAAHAHVVVGDLTLEAAEQLAGELDGRSGRVVPVQVDVTDQARVEALGAYVQATFGRLDLAVNSAGIGVTNQPVVDHDPEMWRNVLAVNLDGTFLSLRMELDLIRRTAGRGSIVNMASVLAHRGWAGSAAYVASKHAVIGLTRAAALENAEQGVRVNSVSPGFIETPLLVERHDAEARAAMGALHPLQRLGSPDEVAETVLWLLSDSATFVTGADFAVEGGFLSR
ncbi:MULTISPECIES: SDR family NAD(P)-dependent oxidoreductase [Nocardioides]|uniref:SDR family NAD(P)-dependent oxidoreductase n=1 Tax=Nocardioides vastitatis TaxID=2568655 RepID=A0ABW0ZLX0_9ACTN|nr:SDR family oxidoreductase [Nocardioides sp.]THI96772.1 SDR family oxidoreductase [Nocardioides sp.]